MRCRTRYITYALGGPANNKPGYYPTEYNNFAPRLSLAYTPDSGSMLEKIMGKRSAFRVGGGIVYDHYGSAMAASFASSGSPGLATTVAQPVNTNFTTGFRYTGSGLPTLPTVAGGAFPYTPPLIQGGFTTYSGVSSDLKAPYSYVLNATTPVLCRAASPGNRIRRTSQPSRNPQSGFRPTHDQIHRPQVRPVLGAGEPLSSPNCITPA